MEQISIITSTINPPKNSAGKPLLAGKRTLQQLVHVILLICVIEEILHLDRYMQEKIYSFSSSHVSVEHVES